MALAALGTLSFGAVLGPEAPLIALGSVVGVLRTARREGTAYGVSLGCGFRGGPVFPAIFLGVAMATLGVIWAGLSPTLAAVTAWLVRTATDRREAATTEPGRCVRGRRR